MQQSIRKLSSALNKNMHVKSYRNEHRAHTHAALSLHACPVFTHKINHYVGMAFFFVYFPKHRNDSDRGKNNFTTMYVEETATASENNIIMFGWHFVRRSDYVFSFFRLLFHIYCAENPSQTGEQCRRLARANTPHRATKRVKENKNIYIFRIVL